MTETHISNYTFFWVLAYCALSQGLTSAFFGISSWVEPLGLRTKILKHIDFSFWRYHATTCIHFALFFFSFLKNQTFLAAIMAGGSPYLCIYKSWPPKTTWRWKTLAKIMERLLLTRQAYSSSAAPLLSKKRNFVRKIFRVWWQFLLFRHL